MSLSGDHFNSDDDVLFALLRQLVKLDKPFLLSSDLWDAFETFCSENGHADLVDSSLASSIKLSQEAAISAPWVYIALRDRIATWSYVRFHVEAWQRETISVSEFLRFKERVASQQAESTLTLEIDLAPFNRDFPKLKESRSIGRGVEFLNRRLSSQLFDELGKGDRRLLDFLRVHQCGGQQLMLTDLVRDVPALRDTLRHGLDVLASENSDATWADVAARLQPLGFAPGWGRTVALIDENLRLLLDILEAPEPQALERFLSRIPMIFNLAILSPHGYFAQAGVLGLPDTGGQVVYILDQVRALEQEMVRRVHEQGLDIVPQILVVTRLIPEAQGTTCDQRLEPIVGTSNAKILRVPFRSGSGEVVPHWISRFKIWPFLERFAQEAEKEIIAELSGRPDLIIGNYSDGNLVASILSRRLHVTQCNIAHALEKTKYLFSDLYWKENDADYHFACQFTADLIAMNKADFIITSTYQEIAGTEQTVGQYESYQSFTLPDLYRVVDGIDMFDPKFNIVSPGANPDVYFPYVETEHRFHDVLAELESLVFKENDHPKTRGCFEDPTKPIIFTIARLDHIKNVTGLVEWFGENSRLRELANLLIVAGHVDPALSQDHDERAQIERMHRLMDQHALDPEMRWLGVQLEKNMSGELYRLVADRRGVFVQPALFEAFGLTVIEAMTSGLPTFATRYGGPLEIIEHGVSGFHIDPNHGESSSDAIADFLDECRRDGSVWERLSAAAVERVQERYTWSRYADRLMTLSRIYGFWKYVTNLEREETHRYLEMFYALQYRPLAAAVPH